MSRPTILVIAPMQDFNQLKKILGGVYDFKMATTLDLAKIHLEKNVPDLILLCNKMAQTSTPHFLQKLKKDNTQTQDVPVILLIDRVHAPAQSGVSEVLPKGFSEYLRRPFCSNLTKRRIATHVSLRRAQLAEINWSTQLEAKVKESTQELDDMMRSAVFMLGDAGHYNDTDTGLHIWRMAAYAAALAKATGWDSKNCELIELAAPMHDTGKIGIPGLSPKAI